MRAQTSFVYSSVQVTGLFRIEDEKARKFPINPLPGGTITFLFTDVEQSTRLWENFPEQMRAALARHDALAKECIAQHGGMLVKERGEGDSLFATFARAGDAAAAAAALQNALFAESWPSDTPLLVRMALHTGEVETRDGDYYGATLSRCARIRAIAHGGQILFRKRPPKWYATNCHPACPYATWEPTA